MLIRGSNRQNKPNRELGNTRPIYKFAQVKESAFAKKWLSFLDWFIGIISNPIDNFLFHNMIITREIG